MRTKLDGKLEWAYQLAKTCRNVYYVYAYAYREITVTKLNEKKTTYTIFTLQIRDFKQIQRFTLRLDVLHFQWNDSYFEFKKSTIVHNNFVDQYDNSLNNIILTFL